MCAAQLRLGHTLCSWIHPVTLFSDLPRTVISLPGDINRRSSQEAPSADLDSSWQGGCRLFSLRSVMC